MKFYKLLSQDMTSHKDTKWELNIPITVTKEGIEMCSDQVLHCYNHPLLAIMFNPVHANITNPKLFEIEVDKIVNTDGLKYASKQQTLIKEIDIPEISTEQKVEFAIRVAKLTYKDTKWNIWADNWLNNTDRTKESANAAYYSATNAAYAATYAAANASAAWSAAWSARATVNAVGAASARPVTYVYYASASASASAYTATHAADAYATDKNEFNKQMIEIIESIVNKD